MQSKFGFKDFVLMVLVVAVGIISLLAILQDDRRHSEVKEIKTAVAEARNAVQATRRSTETIERDMTRDIELIRDEIAAIRDTIQNAELNLGSTDANNNNNNARRTGRPRSDDWARPGVPITRPDPYTFVHDPREYDDFTEGGEFVEIFEAQLKKITPFFYQDVYGRRIVDGVVCESLARYHPTRINELVGLLAEAWQMDPEGMWLRARIRDEARFSDGEPVTADDFVFSYNLVMDPQLDTARFKSTLDVIDEVIAISDKVVEFTFDKPQFSNKTAALRMYVIPRHFYEQFQPQQLNEATGLALGSGPYRLETVDPNDQWTQGEPVVLVRNENYWGVAPPIERRRYIVRQDAIARLAAFENREGDMMRPTPGQFASKTRDASFLDRNHALNWTNMRSGYAFIAWNCGERNGEPTPFADKRVRQAMTMLIDRQAFILDIVNGLGSITTGPFSPLSDQYNASLEPWPYDPERAQQLLADAGWIDTDNDGILENEEGREFRFDYMRSTLTSPTAERSVQFLRDAFERAGIIMDLQAQDWSVLSDTVARRDFDAVSFAWSASAPESDPNQLWHSDQIKNAGDNFAQWNSPEADELIEEGRATLDDEKRMEIWNELHAVIHEDQPYTFLYASQWLRFISRGVGNVHTHEIGLEIEEMFIREPGI